MCATCGCGIPEDTHGDARNIPWSAIVAAAEAASLPPGQVAQNVLQLAQELGAENS